MNKQLYDKNHNQFYPFTEASAVTDASWEGTTDKSQSAINSSLKQSISRLESNISSGVTSADVSTAINNALKDLTMVKSINGSSGALKLATINGQSLLGNDNITIQASGGSITLGKEITDNQTNAVSGKTIYNYVTSALQNVTGITVDSTIVSNSTNPVQSGVLQTYLSNNYAAKSHTHTYSDISDFEEQVKSIINSTTTKCSCPLASATQDGLLSKDDYELLQNLKAEYQKTHFAITSFTVTPSIVTKSVLTQFTLQWVTTSGYTISKIQIENSKSLILNSTTDGSDMKVSDTSYAYTYSDSLSSDTSYVLYITDSNGNTATKTFTVTVTEPVLNDSIYIGGVDDTLTKDTLTADIVSNLTSYTKDEMSAGVEVSTTQQKLVLAYPTSYTLDSATNGGLPWTIDWPSTTLTVDGTDYICYIDKYSQSLTDSVFTLNFK